MATTMYALSWQTSKQDLSRTHLASHIFHSSTQMLVEFFMTEATSDLASLENPSEEVWKRLISAGGSLWLPQAPPSCPAGSESRIPTHTCNPFMEPGCVVTHLWVSVALLYPDVLVGWLSERRGTLLYSYLWMSDCKPVSDALLGLSPKRPRN